MSKRPFSETAEGDLSESNKKPVTISANQQSNDSQNNQPIKQQDTQTSDEHRNQLPLSEYNNTTMDQTGDPLTNVSSQTIDQTDTQSIETSQIQSENPTSSNKDSIVEDQSVNPEPEILDQKDDRNKNDDVESDYDEGSDVVLEYGIPQLSDYSIHFVDCCSDRITVHCHAHVLASMSKFFETLILDADDKTPSTCNITKRCKTPGHRCLEWVGCKIGGHQIWASFVGDFFGSLYAAYDGSGRSLKQYTDHRVEKGIPDELFLRLLISVDKIKRSAVFECWDHHDRYELTYGYLPGWDWDNPPKPETCWMIEHEMNDWLFFLANYFQCESLMKFYENNVIAVMDRLHRWSSKSGEGFNLYWNFLLFADKYKWSALRKKCLKAVATDKECRSRLEWENICKSIKRTTLLDAFASAVAAQR